MEGNKKQKQKKTNNGKVVVERPRRSVRLQAKTPTHKQKAKEEDIEDIVKWGFSRDETQKIRESLLEWYDQNKRDLPWRYTNTAESEEEETKRAYGVWVSEEVNEMWAGLGYYRRARFLLEGARMIVAKGSGFPKTVSALKKIQGIGDYTAGAIASIAFKEVVPVVDGNVIRVIARLRAISANPKDSVTVKKLCNLRFVKYLPNITGQRNQFEPLGGFDGSKKAIFASVSTAGRPIHISEWVTGEGSGTHKDEEGEIPSSGEGLGGSPIADMNSDEGLTHKEESREFQSSGGRLSGPFVIDTKLDDHVLGSEDHGTVVEAGLSVDREPAHSPIVVDQIVDHGARFLVTDIVNGACSTTIENSGCPVQVQSQVRVRSDLYFPISEVGHGLVDFEVPRLIWDTTLPSGKGEEVVNPEVITPLALWDPNGSFDLVSMEDGSDGVSVEDVIEPSEWDSLVLDLDLTLYCT
ncbi:adenine dna glycosylase [Quercus suber]|uniref:Adenine dna glycosylase n=1 Tax=Quercus suber TaxID=58331 RepID=A0AAW0KGM7_QUESU